MKRFTHSFLSKYAFLFLFVLKSITPPYIDFTNHIYCQDTTNRPESQTNKQNLTSQTSREKQYFQKGEKHFYQKRFYTAGIFFKKVIEINPENAYAHSYLGDIYFHQKQLDLALHHYQIASELLSETSDLKNPIIPINEYYRISQILYIKGNYDKSQFYCKKIIKVQNNFYPCFFYLGLISLKYKKNRKKSLLFFRKYLKGIEQELQNYPNHSYLQQEKEKVIQIVQFLSNPRDNQKNTRDLKKELDPLRLFYAFQKQNNNTSIIQKQKPKPLFSIPKEKRWEAQWIEIQYLLKHNPKKAISRLQQYKQSRKIKTAKENFYIRKSLCYIYLQKKKYKKAKSECEQAIQFHSDPEILFYLSMIYQHFRDEEKFVFYLNQYVKHKKEDWKAQLMLVHYYWTKKQYSKSLAILEKLNSIKPDLKESLYYQFKIYKETNQIPLMKNIARKMMIFYQNDTLLMRNIAFEFLEKQEVKFALELLKNIYHQTRSIEDGLMITGIYLQQENTQQALEILSELYQNYPYDYRIVRSLIILFTRTKKNLDTVEIIARKFLKYSESPQEKKEILNILPAEVKDKISQSRQHIN